MSARGNVRRARVGLALLGLAVLTIPAAANPLPVEMPVVPFELAPGPGREVAEANCAACHSADYIATQPRGLANPTSFWTAEVTKMQKVYGAPIEPADAAAIVAYLAATYAKPDS